MFKLYTNKDKIYVVSTNFKFRKSIKKQASYGYFSTKNFAGKNRTLKYGRYLMG